jgi:hypothetical protein
LASSVARACSWRARCSFSRARSVSRRSPVARWLIARATTSMAPSAMKCSWLSTSKVQRGGTKKKFKAVTAATAQTEEPIQSSL